MIAGRRRFGAFGAAAAVFVGLVLLAHVVRIVEPFGVDQGLFACFTRWVPRGWLPYRDLFDSKPPLFLYSYALAALLPGEIAHAIWWVEAAFLAGSLYVAFSLGRARWSRWTGLSCAALLFLSLWSPAWGGFWSRAQAEELLALPMIGSAWLALRAIDRHPLAAWAGALAGICGLYKIPSMAIAGAWAVMWLLTVRPTAALRRIALLACGIAIPWLLTVIWFGAHHALDDFVAGVFVYHRYNAAFIAPPWLDVIEDFTAAMATRAPWLLVAAAVGLYAMAERGARELRWLGPWIAFTMAAVVLQRQLAGYHYLLAMPALAVAGGYGLVVLAEAASGDVPRLRIVGAAGLVAIGALVAREASSWVRAYGPDEAMLVGRISRDVYLRRIQPGSFSMATEEDAARYVREHSAPSDRLLVWGLSPGVYALADREPVTRYPFHKILMTDAPLSRMIPGLPERRARFMDGVRARPPAYVLVGRGDANGFEPEDSVSSMMRFGPLRAMLERDYRVETTVGRFLVYRRNAALPEPPEPSPERDPLDDVRLEPASIDWSRPLPPTPPGGLAEPGYVGSSACDLCHSTISETYARHSMARTGMRPLASLDARWLQSIFDAGSTRDVRNERSGYSYRPYRQGDRYFVEASVRGADGAPIVSSSQPLTLALSAGTYGMSFYFRQGNRMVQAPIDYYAKRGSWDVDAGAFNGGDPRFTKSLDTSCIACHSDYPRRRAATSQEFFDPMPPGIGCERCHGPGERHVHSGRAEDIVNPARLPSARQLDVCAQCHESDHLGLREGRTDFSYRPGDVLAHNQVSWIAQPPEADRFMLLAHPERMVASACYQRSGGALRCTSCHDPHVSSIDEPASWWDAKCNACHETRPCTEERSARQAQGDHCIRCHMRPGPTSRLPLVSVTDHWIQRRPPPIRPGFTEPPARLASWPGLLGEPAAGADLTALEALAWADAGARERALPLVVQAAANGAQLPALYERIARHFDERGAPATAALAYAHVLRQDPDSRSALLGYAHERTTMGGADGLADGLRALDRALAIDGDDPAALEAKGMALFSAGRAVEAQPLFERAASLAPWTSASHVALAALAVRAGDHGAAVAHLEAARRIEPSDAWVIDHLVAEYTLQGDPGRADEASRSRAALSAIGREPRTTPASAWLPAAWR